LSKDDERQGQTSATLRKLAMIRRMVRRVVRSAA